MRLPDEQEVPFNINIVSMIDVVFSILTYFIFSSLVLARSEGLDVNLPKASTAQVQQTEQINITIKPDGAIALNREPISLEQLQPKVQGMVKPNTESMVVVNADEQVDHGIVVAVMDRIRQIKGVKLAIAAKKP
ncbi:MAG: biopolymer transporter ExbD [Cyanosarcina radialis HA8281-LM2]|jgi:biopolymer transport protein ExbD|nr:biopolymer transporter ExbD [Cyanosarcina radialis HA8281-LM2]